jgi:hypothetical protein
MSIKYAEVGEIPCPTLTSSAHGVDQPDSTSLPALTESTSSALSADPESPDPLTKKTRNYGGRVLKGREHTTLERQAPWKKANLSRSTWFRRRRDGTLD